jgi:hypothetical protein
MIREDFVCHSLDVLPLRLIRQSQSRQIFQMNREALTISGVSPRRRQFPLGTGRLPAQEVEKFEHTLSL